MSLIAGFLVILGIVGILLVERLKTPAYFSGGPKVIWESKKVIVGPYREVITYWRYREFLPGISPGQPDATSFVTDWSEWRTDIVPDQRIIRG